MTVRCAFGGVDLRDATLQSLRERIVVVPQEGFLFTGTIRDNVRVGRPDATDAEVEDALPELGILDRFKALPDGLDTEVRERGSRLVGRGAPAGVARARGARRPGRARSSTRRRRTSIPGTERAVELALEQLTEDRTVIVVAHRLSTAARADRVAVVDAGRLVELGTHEELVDARRPLRRTLRLLVRQRRPPLTTERHAVSRTALRSTARRTHGRGRRARRRVRGGGRSGAGWGGARRR